MTIAPCIDDKGRLSWPRGLLRELPEGYVCPRLWGFCWRDWYGQRTVIAPIGLNVLIAAARWAWLWVEYDAARWLKDNEPPFTP